MATRVILPKQGLQMTEGTITKWYMHEGDRVERGEPLFEMQTDKIALIIEAPASGLLLRIFRHEGDVVPVAETIGVIGQAGENVTEFSPETEQLAVEPKSAAEIATPRLFSTPRARWLAAEKGLLLENIEPTGPERLMIARDVENAAINKIKITPVAKKMIEQQDISLSDIRGTGARGKITKADVKDLVMAGKDTASVKNRVEQLVPISGMRKVIAERMMQSVQQMAQANHRMKVDVSQLINLREAYAAAGKKVTFTDILVRIVADVLMEYPMLNASLTPQGILLRNYVNIGIAVAVDNGLIVPVIKDADTMNLIAISAKAKELIEKTKSGTLSVDDYSGGTFTITNLGMFDIDEFTAIINPPESAILAAGKIERTPVVEGETMIIRPIMVLSLTYDHRLIDGALAAQFLQRIKQVVNNPCLLL